MDLAHRLDTPPNKRGIIALDSETSLLAFPQSDSEGTVFVFDAYQLEPKVKISAHRKRIQILKFHRGGRLLATGSEEGTLIKVFSIPKGDCLVKLRRGSFQQDIHDVAFDL